MFAESSLRRSSQGDRYNQPLLAEEGRSSFIKEDKKEDESEKIISSAKIKSIEQEVDELNQVKEEIMEQKSDNE